MGKYLDGKQGTWDPHKDIEAKIEFDKMMASGGPGQEGFVETPDQEDSWLWGMVLMSDIELLFSFLYSWHVLLCISYACARLLLSLIFYVYFTSAAASGYFVC